MVKKRELQKGMARERNGWHQGEREREIVWRLSSRAEEREYAKGLSIRERERK